MRHLTLTCKNHPNLRWTCKSIAWRPGTGYNGARNIFFKGKTCPPDQFGRTSSRYEMVGVLIDLVEECTCSGKDLILAPEETPLTEEELNEF